MSNPQRRPSASEELSRELNSPAPNLRAGRRALLTLSRVATWAVMAPPRAGLRAWARLRPAQQLVLGFALYAIVGTILLCLPFAQQQPARALDHLFSAVSAISTTGLVTISVPDSYTWFGEAVLLLLFQVGGLGFMTLSSLLIIARGRQIDEARMGVLRAGFSVPRNFVMQHFLVHVAVFTVACEAVGALVLWWRFSALGVDQPLWQAVFHSVSAFTTAGFSLNNNSLESFADDWIVNLVIGLLSYTGAIGFIVAQDLWYSLKLRERMLTLTSKVILSVTAVLFVAGSATLFFAEPSLRALPTSERLLASAFQMMTASSTAGFNTISIGALSAPAIVVLLLAMLIGASPSGTGGGIKTTSVSAILGNLLSVLRGRRNVTWMGHEVPMARVLYAFAATSLYLIGLGVGVLALCLTERHAFLAIVFEATSALSTVGLSMGITADLSAAGKILLIVLMFAGRCGPLTIGLALLRPEQTSEHTPRDDLAV